VQPLRQKRAAPMDANEGGYAIAGVALDDLVRDARQRTPDFPLAEDHLLVAFHRFLPGLAGPG
jgi:hypothetical protein